MKDKIKQPSPILQDKSILVVDDHQFIRTIIGNLLTSLKVKTVNFAKDGVDAIVMLRAAAGEITLGEAEGAPGGKKAPAGAYDCILTDFNMAPINGLTLLKKIRCGQTAAPRGTPVVMLTGHSEAYLIAAAMALDVNGFLLKPASREALEARLVRVFETPFKARAPEAYEPVDIPEAPNARSAPIGIDLTKEKKHDVGQELTVEQVKYGSILARDVRGEDGAVIIRRGTMVTSEVLQMLKDLSGMPGMDTTIWVRTAGM